MAERRQGDIFEVGTAHKDALILVFGHRGFNAMSVHWQEFQKRTAFAEWQTVHDPFCELESQGPVRPAGAKNWYWFVHAYDNHGLSDDVVRAQMEAAKTWAAENGAVAVVTNGVRDIDHGTSTARNTASTARRVALLMELASPIEEAGIPVVFTSLNDAFVRGT